MMAGIGAKNTGPEMTLRRGLHALGRRYRLHGKLPGKPDLVFAKSDAVIFVNGCFWHGHACHLFRLPGTRTEFWRAKIAGNVARDARVRSELAALGWRVGDVWECTLKGRTRLPPGDVLAQCTGFLDSRAPKLSVGGSQTVTVSDCA